MSHMRDNKLWRQSSRIIKIRRCNNAPVRILFVETAALGGSIRQVKEEEETDGKAKWAATADWSQDPPLNAASAERAIYELVRSPYNSDCWNTPGRHIFFNPRLVTVPFSSPSLHLSLSSSEFKYTIRDSSSSDCSSPHHPTLRHYKVK